MHELVMQRDDNTFTRLDDVASRLIARLDPERSPAEFDDPDDREEDGNRKTDRSGRKPESCALSIFSKDARMNEPNWTV